MKVLAKPGYFLLLLLALLAPSRAPAQLFGLSISNSPGPVFTGVPLTYTINVTNFSSSGTVVVTDFFPVSLQFLSASNAPFLGSITNGPGVVVFTYPGTFPIGGANVLTVTVVPTNQGPLSNLVVAGVQGVTNVVAATDFTFVSSPVANVALTMTGPTPAVLANDWMTYTVAVSNPGTNSANGIVLSNTLPANVGLIAVAPSNLFFTLSNGVMTFNLGTLTAGASQTIAFTVQPTNAAVYPFTASVSASHATNVTVTTNINVLPFDITQMTAVNFSAMAYNPQNALMEQTVQVMNVGTSNIFGARVVVSGLTNVLVNAVGTNNGNPFVQYDAPTNAPLAPGQTVNLLLQYFVPTRLPITVPNSAYAAVPIPTPNNAAPAGTPFQITLVTNLSGGRVLIEFQSIPGRSYTILYANNPAMTNSLAAQPAITAPADRVQWIDSGPPGTISSPTNVSSRFYSVLLNP